MGGLRLILRRASTDDFEAVHGLRAEAAAWLRTMPTDQWAEFWPSQGERMQLILAAIRAGRTWIAWDGARPAATITASPNHHEIWPVENRRDPAVYVRRLVVSRDRKYAGHGLGAQLLDWAGLRANREYGARWVRVDVWTTNTKLHDYYRNLGFEFCGFCEWITDYPSAALFQKPVDEIKPLEDPLFHEAGDP
jgi:GNAT superfamily N-acetyltransferase